MPRVRLQAEVLTFGSPARPRHRAHVKELFPAPANMRRPSLSNKALDRTMIMLGHTGDEHCESPFGARMRFRRGLGLKTASLYVCSKGKLSG